MKQGFETDTLRTLHNATQSLLLRLPAELRYAIWEIAFGNRMIYVDAYHYPHGPDYSSVDFTPYDEVCTDAVGERDRPVTPQLVCRQFWTETSQVFLSSCTFRVDYPYAFRAFALSEHSAVSRVRRLMIHVGGGSHNFPMYWHTVLTSSLVGRFVSLEGLNFTGKVYWLPQKGLRDLDVMGSWLWKTRKLPSVIHSFQQHKLKAELTSVIFEPELRAHEPPGDTEPINGAIREHLLQHRPRRLSKRRS